MVCLICLFLNVLVSFFFDGLGEGMVWRVDRVGCGVSHRWVGLECGGVDGEEHWLV